MGALLAVNIGASVVKSIGSLLLGQHSARLANAKSENAAIPAAVQAFDADLHEIFQAYTSGQASASMCIAALKAVDTSIYAYLSSMGKRGVPGVAWSDTAGMAGKCDKTCTASCCVYFGDLGPSLSNSSVAIGGPAIRGWGKGDPRLHGTTVDVPRVYASKFGGVDRPGYTLVWKAPAKLASHPSSTIVLQQPLANQQPIVIGSPESTVDSGVANVAGFAIPSRVAGFPITTLAIFALLAAGTYVAVKK